jgi:hypothetical protein
LIQSMLPILFEAHPVSNSMGTMPAPVSWFSDSHGVERELLNLGPGFARTGSYFSKPFVPITLKFSLELVIIIKVG